MKKYLINVKIWFDKLNGNTYHSVDIFSIKKDRLIFSSGLVYGYGEQYKHTAIDGLIKLNLFNEKDRFNHDLIRELFYFNINENCKKRELIQKDV